MNKKYKRFLKVINKVLYISSAAMLIAGAFLTMAPQSVTATPGGGNPGAIWTTDGSCGTLAQDVNQFLVGHSVYINFSNMPLGSTHWTIQQVDGSIKPIVASGDYNITAPEGCFYAYTVVPGDAGHEFTVDLGTKNDNYGVKNDLCSNIAGNQHSYPPGYEDPNGDGICTVPVPGCTDPLANNYNQNATVDDGSCTYDVNGCTDPLANNYNQNATVDDGSCTYDVNGCTDPLANNYNQNANVDDGSCTYDVNGCTDPEANNYNENATVDDGSCTYDVPGCTDPLANNYNQSATVDDGSCTYDVNGCTDPLANNYNQNATVDDGSCTYDVYGCTDPGANNYNEAANVDDGSCTYDTYGCTDPAANNYNKEATVDDGSCTYDVPGCTDPEANNYDEAATVDDGSCTYDTYGCTDPKANNYDEGATVDDGSCTYDEYGCTDPEANNYNPDATIDDQSCTYDLGGCTDPKANNYNPDAVEDDGSCTYDKHGDPPEPLELAVDPFCNANGEMVWTVINPNSGNITITSYTVDGASRGGMSIGHGETFLTTTPIGTHKVVIYYNESDSESLTYTITVCQLPIPVTGNEVLIPVTGADETAQLGMGISFAGMSLVGLALLLSALRKMYHI